MEHIEHISSGWYVVKHIDVYVYFRPALTGKFKRRTHESTQTVEFQSSPYVGIFALRVIDRGFVFSHTHAHAHTHTYTYTHPRACLHTHMHTHTHTHNWFML